MEQQTVVLWVLLSVGTIGFIGYLCWQIFSDLRTKKLAKQFRQKKQPQSVKIFEIERSRYGIPTLILEFTDSKGLNFRKTFRPRAFSSEYSALSIETGEQGLFYSECLDFGAAAWLEVRDYSFWGSIGF
jgi:hypothetical protein